MHYIKKLRFQELGSPKEDGSISRGRYFLISKKSEDFFPLLSETELNDTVIIPIVPPHSEQKVYCSYVFHNDKFHGSTAKIPRNEYRLYLNLKIDPNRTFFKPNDIVVFSKYLQNEGIPIYQIELFREGQDYYDYLDETVNNSSINGGHALIRESLPFIKTSMINLENLETVIPEEIKKVVIEKQNDINDDTSDIEASKGSNLFNSVSFRDFVLLGYQNKCAITNEAIFFDKLINLEAAHIKPKSHSGSFLPCNGIALSRDMHWAFDKGMFTINEEYIIVVHDDLKDNTLLSKYNNKKINLPIEDFFKPEKTFLKYHSERIFGLFKYSGVLRSNI